MEDTPYEEWADFLEDLIKKYGISKPLGERKDFSNGEGNLTLAGTAGREDENRMVQEEALETERNLVLDLGCGTGTLTELMYAKGYDMIGVDNSEAMLHEALEKKEKSGSEILYLCQDIRDLDLYSTVGTVLSVCDSFNYLLEDDEIEGVFSLVNNYLYPGGLFIFDFNTVYKYEKVIGDTTIAENRETCSFIWENYYHEQERINEYDLTIFVKEEKSGLFRRFTETHLQRGYRLDEMLGFVEKAGMEVILVLDADTHEKPGEMSERIYVAARERGKQKG
ncbi:class I SAM-dependent methyltransferase [bacterium 1xD42-62]|uniref:Class I SAM-dependent methyltransferase n=2 Tax=Parablautia muri TaxID=2320879 RepID=A0A9X5BGB6_9FIRM|nr:class I SAM-dependent methyltransferase [Parablautia muri]NBJ92587.1 class I SAM-dependent methyltransferase [Parablautia muri]